LDDIDNAVIALALAVLPVDLEELETGLELCGELGVEDLRHKNTAGSVTVTGAVVIESDGFDFEAEHPGVPCVLPAYGGW